VDFQVDTSISEKHKVPIIRAEKRLQKVSFLKNTVVQHIFKSPVNATPQSRVLFEKLIVAWLLKKLLDFMGSETSLMC
jgi:hypothetical protein